MRLLVTITLPPLSALVLVCFLLFVSKPVQSEVAQQPRASGLDTRLNSDCENVRVLDVEDQQDEICFDPPATSPFASPPSASRKSSWLEKIESNLAAGWTAFLKSLSRFAHSPLTERSRSQKKKKKAPAESNIFPMPNCSGFKLFEASIESIETEFRSGRLTSRQLVNCYVDRINEINPYLHAVIEVNPDVYQIADELDFERQQGKVRGPMHGIPVLVKDNIATADRMETTCGSNALLGSVVPRDAHVVHLLRQSGAILLGKANLAEWADIRSSDYSEGWSARGGQTRNSYNLTQDPAGSSSGSAQAVSANFVPVAIGTETDGSVIGPAQRAGIIGIKPTVGLTSRSGVIPESHSQDTVGVFGRTFIDAAHVLNAIRGIDSRDSVTEQQQGRVPHDYTKFVRRKSALKGVRLGIPWDRIWQGTAKNQWPQLFRAVADLRAAGAIIVNNTDLPNIHTIAPNPPEWNWMYKNQIGRNNESEFTVVCYEFKRDLNQYLSELISSPVRNLTEIIQFNLAHADAEMKYFKQDILEKCDSDPYTEEEYLMAKRYIQSNTREHGIDAALRKYHLDALLVPSDNWGLGTQIPAQAGYPMVTLPAGMDPFGVPFGLSLWGTAFSEPRLIKIGSAMDDALRRRVPPRFFEHTAQNIPINGEYRD